MRVKRIAAFLLVALALQCMMTTSAFASDKAAQPRFSAFSSIYAGLYDVGNGIYVIEGTAAAPNASKRVYITLTLEKIEGNKSTVVPGCTWTASGMVTAQTSARRSLSPGTYQAHTYAEVYLGDTLLETADAYSNVEFVH